MSVIERYIWIHRGREREGERERVEGKEGERESKKESDTKF